VPKPKAVAPGSSSGKRGSSGLQLAMTEAKKAKTQYNAAATQAAQVLTLIEKDSEWKWASHVTVSGELLKAKAALEASIGGSPFAKQALSTDLHDLRGSWAPPELETELGRFTSTVIPLVESVSAACKRLVRQQQARNAV